MVVCIGFRMVSEQAGKSYEDISGVGAHGIRKTQRGCPASAAPAATRGSELGRDCRFGPGVRRLGMPRKAFWV